MAKWVERMEQNEKLDRGATVLAKGAAVLARRPAVRNLLRGKWLGSPLHPSLTDITIGAVTSGVLLDAVGRDRMERGADLLLTVGTLSVVPTAAAGLTDWLSTSGGARRIGVVHASANTVALLLFTLSLGARGQGNRARGKRLSYLGFMSLMTGGYLGGQLTYKKGVRVGERS